LQNLPVRKTMKWPLRAGEYLTTASRTTPHLGNSGNLISK
jgi:hypothetical protein